MLTEDGKVTAVTFSNESSQGDLLIPAQNLSGVSGLKVGSISANGDTGFAGRSSDGSDIALKTEDKVEISFCRWPEGISSASSLEWVLRCSNVHESMDGRLIRIWWKSGASPGGPYSGWMTGDERIRIWPMCSISQDQEALIWVGLNSSDILWPSVVFGYHWLPHTYVYGDAEITVAWLRYTYWSGAGVNYTPFDLQTGEGSVVSYDFYRWACLQEHVSSWSEPPQYGSPYWEKIYPS